MKKIKLIAPILGAAAAVGAIAPLSSCGPSVTALTVSGDTTVRLNKEATYTAKLGSSAHDVTWSLKDDSEKEFATIDENGKLTTLKMGKVHIIATSKSDTTKKSDPYEVTISYPEFEGFELEQQEFYIVQNKTKQIQIKSYTPAECIDNIKSIQYEPENPIVANVDSTGKITGKNVGSTKVNVTVTDKYDISKNLKCEVSVVEPVTSMEIEGQHNVDLDDLASSSTSTATFKIKDQQSREMPFSSIKWTFYTNAEGTATTEDYEMIKTSDNESTIKCKTSKPTSSTSLWLGGEFKDSNGLNVSTSKFRIELATWKCFDKTALELGQLTSTNSAAYSDSENIVLPKQYIKDDETPITITTLNSIKLVSTNDLGKLYIPSNIITISNDVLNGTKISDIVVDPNNTEFSSKDSAAGTEQHCVINKSGGYNTIVLGCKGVTSIPSTITTIGDGAFRNCTNITGITIPNTVTTIGARAFSGADGLTSGTGITFTPDSTNYGQWKSEQSSIHFAYVWDTSSDSVTNANFLVNGINGETKYLDGQLTKLVQEALGAAYKTFAFTDAEGGVGIDTPTGQSSTKIGPELIIPTEYVNGNEAKKVTQINSNAFHSVSTETIYIEKINLNYVCPNLKYILDSAFMANYDLCQIDVSLWESSQIPNTWGNFSNTFSSTLTHQLQGKIIIKTGTKDKWKSIFNSLGLFGDNYSKLADTPTDYKWCFVEE